jgi:hypothetical protein
VGDAAARRVLGASCRFRSGFGRSLRGLADASEDHLRLGEGFGRVGNEGIRGEDAGGQFGIDGVARFGPHGMVGK